MEGKLLLIMWQMSWPAEINVSYSRAFSFFGGMHQEQFKKFWDARRRAPGEAEIELDISEVETVPGWASDISNTATKGKGKGAKGAR